MSQLSLAEAAREVGVSKASIWRAVKSGRLSASRGDDGTYRIDPSELARAFPPEPARTAMVKQRETAANGEVTAVIAAKDDLITELRARITAADARASDLAEERNHWRALAERIALPAPSESARPGFFRRLFGRS